MKLLGEGAPGEAADYLGWGSHCTAGTCRAGTAEQEPGSKTLASYRVS